jgi:hypothetical protein
MYCCVPFRGKVTLAGVIAIEDKVPEIVTTLAGEVIVPREAVMELLLPLAASTVAKPALLMPTPAGFEDFQVTEDVMFAVVPLV